MAAPTLASTIGNIAISQATPKTSSVTVQAGDLIVVKAAAAEPNTYLTTPTGGGLTFTAQQVIENATNQTSVYVWTAQSPTAQTFTLSIGRTNAGYWSYEIKIWRNHGGVGTSAKKYATSTTSLSMTTTGANSAVEVLNADWNGNGGSSRTWLTSAGAFTETTYQQYTNWITLYAGHHADTGAVGTYSFGMSAPSGQAPSLIAVEILAAPPVQTGSLSITATALPNNAPPAIKVSVDDTRSPGQASSLTIMRVNPDGTKSPVRTSDGNPLPLSSGVGQVYDYEVPLGQPVSYTSTEVPGVTSPQVTVTSSRPWLVHPGTPSLSVQVLKFLPGSFTKRTRRVARGVFQVMGRANPVVVTDGARKGVESSMTLLVTTADQRDALEALLADTSTLLLNIPPSLGYTFGTCYVAVGDVDEAPAQDKVFEPWMGVTLPFTVVDRPAGGSQAQRTYSDVLADYGSYAAVQSAYATYLDLLTGP